MSNDDKEEYYKRLSEDFLNRWYADAQEKVKGSIMFGVPVDHNDPRQVAAIMFQVWHLANIGALSSIGGTNDEDISRAG